MEGGVDKGCEARSSKSSSPPLFFPFLPSPQTISIAVSGLLGMDEILAQIAQLREQARLQAVANEAQASSLLLLSFSVRAQEAAIARLSSENETLKKTVGDQDGVIGELVRAHPSGGFWIGREGRKGGSRKVAGCGVWSVTVSFLSPSSPLRALTSLLLALPAPGEVQSSSFRLRS